MAAAPGSNAPILRGVAFALAPGEVLGVVGPSSGKTVGTCADRPVALPWGQRCSAWMGPTCLPGISWNWAPTWAITCRRAWSCWMARWRKTFARFGEAIAKVEAAARLVGRHDFILALPGNDSWGRRVIWWASANVALARALYGDPCLWCLDEPNSSLDEAGDAALLQAIAQMKAPVVPPCRDDASRQRIGRGRQNARAARRYAAGFLVRVTRCWQR